MMLRFFIVNFFSFVKRLFASKVVLYNVIIFLPLLTVFTSTISKRSLKFVLLFTLVILITGNAAVYHHFIPFFLLLIALPMFGNTDFDKLICFFIPFFLLVSIYGIYQKIFGYSRFEIEWIKSGISIANEEGYFTGKNIRPFSTFASIPEFTLFIAIYVYYSFANRKFVLLFFSIFMLFVAGSRGVIVATLISLLVIFVFKKATYKKKLVISFCLSLVVYLSLIYLFPLLLFENNTSSRMLVYGTFNGRIENLALFSENLSIINLLFGSFGTSLDSITSDNLYFTLLSRFGLFSGIYFLYFLIKGNDSHKSFFFISIFIGYGFYADMIFSYYLMFLFFFGIYSKSHLSPIK